MLDFEFDFEVDSEFILLDLFLMILIDLELHCIFNPISTFCILFSISNFFCRISIKFKIKFLLVLSLSFLSTKNLYTYYIQSIYF